MNNVIGPFTPADWMLMQELKKSIAFMTQADPEKYKIAIKKERAILKDFFRAYSTKGEEEAKRAA